MKTIKANETLTARAFGDYNCIFTLEVIERKKNFVTVKYMNDVRRVKVRIDNNGNEYLRPDNYSMSPMFRAK